MNDKNSEVLPQGRYFITGASGFVGRHLVDRILRGGGDVLAVGRTAPEGFDSRVVSKACDIQDPSSIEKCLDQTIDFAIHLAAKVGDWGPRADFMAANVDGTQNVISVLLDKGVSQIVHTSSIAALGHNPGNYADEHTPLIERGDPYSESKAKAEVFIRDLQAKGAPVVIVRPGDIYGPHCEPWVERPLEMMASRQMIFVDGGHGNFSHVYVDTLLEGMLAALIKPEARGQTYLLTDGVNDTTIKTYFTELAKACGVAVPSLSVPESVANVLAMMMEAGGKVFGLTPPITRTAIQFVQKRSGYDISKARRELGYDPQIDLKEGLRRIAEVHGV